MDHKRPARSRAQTGCLLSIGFLTFEINFQYKWKPARCRRTTVSGVTMMRACFQPDQNRRARTLMTFVEHIQPRSRMLALEDRELLPEPRGTIHLFLAVPAGLAVMIGQTLNTFGPIQTYEHVGTDAVGVYKPAALLASSA